MKRLAITAFLAASLIGTAAHAAPAKCGAMYKDLQSLGGDLKKLQARQASLKETFEAADAARASARADLDNLSIGVGGAQSAELIQISYDEADDEAVAAKAELEVLNVEVLEKGAKRQSAVEAFNKSCIED